MAVRLGRLIGAPVLGTLTASRPACPLAARRTTGTAKGSAVRVPSRQAVLAAARTISIVHEACRPPATLLGKAPDSASGTRRRVGRATVADAEEAPGVVEAGVTAVPHLNIPAAVAVSAPRATGLPTSGPTGPASTTCATFGSTGPASRTGSATCRSAAPAVRQTTLRPGRLALASSDCTTKEQLTSWHSSW